jgi:tetratricopeptide (TPR) repeat protein
MARRRRLNKKVALLGTTVLLLSALAAVCLILRLNRDPAPLIADGDAARAAHDYQTARESYTRAYGLMRSSEGKIDLLFKLADVYRELNQWDRVLGCWGQVLTSEPQNVKARLGQLKYAYLLADGIGDAGRSVSEYWEDVLSQARKTTELIEKSGLTSDEKTTWEPSFGAVEDHAWRGGARQLGPHLHFIKGRAAYELAALGAVTSPGELLQEAQNDLEQAKKLDPNNVQAYRYLAEVFIKEGEAAASRGNMEQNNAAQQRADEILAEAVRVAGQTPEAHINVLTRKLTVAQRGSVAATREQMQALEPQYEDLTHKFPSRPQVFAALGQFYSFYAAYLDSAGALDKLNRAIQATERAHVLDRGNVEYPALTASYHYRKFSVYGDVPTVNKAIELTERALELPGAQDKSGPLQFANRVHRLSLCSLLGKCCVERLLTLPKSDHAREGLLARLGKTVHEIGQIRGSGEDLEVVKWQGMLDLAKGRTGKAVRSLYAAYEQIKAANAPEQRDPFLSWTLAKIFEHTGETGAVIDFLRTALGCGIVYARPEAMLDYVAALLRAGSYDTALNIAGIFEERFGGNDRSRGLRIKALIAKGILAEAEKEIAKLNPSDPNVLVLSLDLTRARSNQLFAAAGRAITDELRGCKRQEAELVQRLLQVNPEVVGETYTAELCELLIAGRDVGTAKAIVEAVLQHTPDNVTALFYRGLLAEPDPRNCPPVRRRELQEQAAGAVTDRVRRSLELGVFFEQTQQLDKAISQWRNVLVATRAEGVPPSDAGVRAGHTPAYGTAMLLSPRHVAAGHLFDLARRQENWPLAEEMAELAKRDNLDDCSGHLFAARLAFAKKDYDGALSHLDECLRERPVFSYGYVLRSDVQAALGREQESIEDARKASELNPKDALVAKGLAKALYARDRRLGANQTSDQRQETKQALDQAVRLDPRDPSLLNAYVDFLSGSEPEKAVALRQTIQANAPSVDNAVALGKLAMQIALKERDQAKQNAFFGMAQTAFEQARKLDPASPVALDSFAEYYRARGQNEAAEQLLSESKDRWPLWRHYLRVGKYDEAIDGIDRCIQSAGPQTEAGLQYTAQKAQLLTAAYNATSDKTYLQKAIGVYESLRLKWPKNSSVLNNLAYLLAQNDEKLAEALELARTAVEQNPDEANYLDTYGYLLYRSGQPAQAAPLLAAAVRKHEARGKAPMDVYEHLGLVHEALGERGKALDAYRRALEVGGTAVSEATRQRINAAVARLAQ